MDELADFIAGRAVAEGPTASRWPGLDFYRFSGPARVEDRVTTSLSIYVIAQGRGRVQLDDRTCDFGPSEWFVVPRGTRLVADVVEASRGRPLLAVSLQIDPVVIVELLRQIEQCSDGATPPPEPSTSQETDPACVSPIGHELADALLRFVRATVTELDRHVLAPLLLRGTTYWALLSRQWAALAEAAHLENAADRIAAAIAFMQEALDKPIKVEDMANHVEMSVSAFAHLFKATTGTAPYQYLKRLRMERSRALLVEENLAVGDACHAVGYSTASHFISEFKRTYGETPRAYAGRMRRIGTLAPPHAAR